MRSRVNKSVSVDKTAGDPDEKHQQDPIHVVSPSRRQRSNTVCLISLCVVHLFFAFVIGLHKEWAWSTELLRIVTELPYSVAAFTDESAIDDVTKQLQENEVTSPSLMKVSLYKTFSLEWPKVLAERERNMKKYNFTYNRNGIDKRSNLSLQEYRDVYDGKWPVIISDVVSTWTASNWSHEFLCDNYGHERVAMKAVKDGRLDKASTVSLPLGLFCNHTNDTSPTMWTYVEDELFLPTRPFLRSDVGTSIYTAEDMFQLFPEEIRPWDAMLLWGTRYSRSSLHIDPYNWTGTNAVIRGLKRWKFFHPGQDHLLYVMPNKLSYFPLNCHKYNSPIDTYDPTHTERYPLWKQAEYLEVDQLPGELMIIPTGWFHQAFNDDETIAVSGQMTNVNNYRIVLEEILKLKENLERTVIPPSSNNLDPSELVSLVMSLLPKHILDLGRKTTQDNLQQIQRIGL